MATTTCAPLSCAICLPKGMPPMTLAIRTPRTWRTKLIASWLTCWANSRVGHSTKTAGDGIDLRRTDIGGCSFTAKWLIDGSKNATVLPLPVWLDTKRSLPSRASGIAASCTAVGVENSKSIKPCFRVSAIAKSEKVRLIKSTAPVGRSVKIQSNGSIDLAR